MRRITAMSRHRDHLRSVASSLHFYGMREAPAISLRDRGPLWLRPPDRTRSSSRRPGSCRRPEFDDEGLAAPGQPATGPCASRRGRRSRYPGAQRGTPGAGGTWSLPGDGTRSITARHLATAVIGSREPTSLLDAVQQGPRLHASEHAPGRLARRSPGQDAIGAWKAPGRGHRREAAAGVGRMRRSSPTLRGRRDSLRPDPGGPAGALAAVIAEAAARVDSGPGARCSSGPACSSPRSGRGANLPGTASRRTLADRRWSLNSCPANDA